MDKKKSVEEKIKKAQQSGQVFISKKVLFAVVIPIAAVILIGLAVLTGLMIGMQKTEPIQVIEETPVPILTPTSTPTPTPTPTPSPTPTPTPEETEEAESTASTSYGRLMRTSDAGDAYYDSLYYVGGVEMVSLALHTGIPDDHVLARDDGFTHISAVEDKRFTVAGASGFHTVPEALGIIKPKGVVLCFGYNGLPYMSDSTFIYYYRELIEAIQEASPKTKIVIQMCYPMTYTAEQEELLKIRDADIGQYTNEKIDTVNGHLQGLAKEMRVYYLDANGVIQLNDTDAAPLDPAYADKDGMKLNRTGNERIAEYIREHKIPGY